MKSAPLCEKPRCRLLSPTRNAPRLNPQFQLGSTAGVDRGYRDFKLRRMIVGREGRR